MTIDTMVGALTDPFDGCHMGVTAENVAEEVEISRAGQEAWLVQSHAGPPRRRGYFHGQIAPVEEPGKGGTVV